MTLIVSLRTPDGIILAGDSLSTMMTNVQAEAEFRHSCPKCKHPHKSKQMITLPPMPATTLSYAQKIFPFLDNYGIGAAGAGILAGKTIQFAIRELEQNTSKLEENERPQSVTEAAKIAGTHIQELLKTQVEKDGQDWSKFPADLVPVTLHIVGYDESEPKSILVGIGKKVTYKENKNTGVTAAGETMVIQTIGSLFTNNPQLKPAYELFSLQDAIEYAEYVIATTARFQHFSKMMATVGGEVDIALVTPFEQFRWIKQKSLQSRLIGEHYEKGH